MAIEPLPPEKLPPPFASRKAGTIDLEWWPATYQLRVCGVTLLRGRELEFTSIEDFLRWFLQPANAGTELWAHYGGKADFAFLIPPLVKAGIRCSGLVIGSSIAALNIYIGRHEYRLRDSFFLFLCGLDTAGRTFAGRGKTEGDFEGGMKQLIEYNREDRRLLLDCLLSVDDLWGQLGTHIGITNASTAWSLFRARYLKEEIPTNDATNDVFRRKAFFASRVERFWRSLEATGKPLALGWDQNSAHPASYSQAMPGRELWGSTTRPTSKDVLWYVDCDIEVPTDLAIPPIPYRRENGRICHPVGRWRALLCQEEVELLEDSGGKIRKAHWYYQFQVTRALEEFGRTLFEAKRASLDSEGQPTALTTVIKYALNGGGFGKTAERPERMELIIGPIPDKLLYEKDGTPREDAEKLRIIAPNLTMVPSFKRAPHEHVVMASTTGARTRVRLTRDMQLYHAYGSNILYCDTDGFKGTIPDVLELTQNERGEWAYSPIVPFTTGDALGAYKAEYRAIVEFYCAGPKLYAMKDVDSGKTIIRAKSFPCRDYGEKRFDGAGQWTGKRKGFLPSSDDKRPDSAVMTYEKIRALALAGTELEDDEPLTGEALVVSFERMRRIPETFASFKGGRLKTLDPGSTLVTKQARAPRPGRCFAADGSSRAWHTEELEKESKSERGN